MYLIPALLLAFLLIHVPPVPAPACQPGAGASRKAAGFTLVEVLIVVALIGLLAAMVVAYRNAQATAQKRVLDSYMELCLTSAEKQRNYLSNQLTLPPNCAALGLSAPAGVNTETIQDNGSSYTITVTGTAYTRSETLPKTVVR